MLEKILKIYELRAGKFDDNYIRISRKEMNRKYMELMKAYYDKITNSKNVQ